MTHFSYELKGNNIPCPSIFTFCHLIVCKNDLFLNPKSNRTIAC